MNDPFTISGHCSRSSILLLLFGLCDEVCRTDGSQASLAKSSSLPPVSFKVSNQAIIAGAVYSVCSLDQVSVNRGSASSLINEAIL